MRALLVLPVLLLAEGCVSAPHAPVAPPKAVAPPAPAQPIARPADWRDWPQTPGDWRYHPRTGGSSASFGAGDAALATFRCDLASRTVAIELARPAAVVTVRTTDLTRIVNLAAGNARLTSRDPLLDAISFSRGRFVLEPAGAEPLVLPAWPEVGRVVQDCRN